MMYGSTKIEKDKTGKTYIRPEYNLTYSRGVYDLKSIKIIKYNKI